MAEIPAVINISNGSPANTAHRRQPAATQPWTQSAGTIPNNSAPPAGHPSQEAATMSSHPPPQANIAGNGQRRQRTDFMKDSPAA
jgi:hypothetical protein